VKRKNFSNISNTFIVVNHTRQFMHTNMYKEICVASFFLFNSFLLERRTTKVNNKTLAKPIVRRWIFFFGSEQKEQRTYRTSKNFSWIFYMLFISTFKFSSENRRRQNSR